MLSIDATMPLEKQAKIHLKTFLAQRGDMLELAHSAIYLLGTVPAARSAVLEFMEQVFDCAVDKIQTDQGHAQTTLVIQQLHQTLYPLVKSSPSIWAPLVSQWSLQLLGFLSSKYADRRSPNLGEVMQRWMSCPPMRSLIDLTSHCMMNAIDVDTDKCINALLDTTIKYSPHFDWVVAHIGSSFPHTVITRVLAVGLKHFMMHDQSIGSDSNKLVSVVGILGHLAGQHSADIKKALTDMIAESLTSQPSKEQLAVIPYLIELCLMSELLLTSIVSDLPHTLSITNLNILAHHGQLWRANKTPVMQNASEKVLVELLLKCGRNEHEALALLSLALRIKQGKLSELRPAAKDYASRFLQSLLEELQKRVYAKLSVPLLMSFELHAKELLNQLDLKCPWTISFISLVCLHCSEKMRFLVEMLTTKTDPTTFIQIMSHIETSHPTVLVDTLDALIVELRSGRIADPILVLHNLSMLVSIEARTQKTLWKFADTLSLHSSDCNLSYTAEIVRLLGVCGLPTEEVPESVLYKIICGAAVVFFAAARIADDAERKALWMSSALKLFSTVSDNELAKQMSLRLLLEGVTDSSTSKLFGTMPREADRLPKHLKMTSLLEENRKIVASINFPQSHSSIMRAGVVGDGLRAGRWTLDKVRLDSRLIRENQKCFLKTLKVCCGKDKSRGMISIATVICDIVNPDVMFNKPAWPIEEVLKATQEKDVDIRESFKASPMLWKILNMIAVEDPPALRSASVLIRSLLGCQMTFWKNSQDSYMIPEQKEITVKVVKLMGVGKLLPSPLADLPLIVDHLNSYHMYCLLNDIWNYMRECSDSVKAEEPIPSRFTTNLRIIMLNKIDKLGPIYARMFKVI